MRIWVPAVVLTVLLVLGCGPAVQQPASSTGPAAGNQPKYGGILNLAVEADPFDWDLSYNGKSTPNQYGISLATNGLLRFKSGPDVEFTEDILLPDLAERWEMSADGRSFTYHLRKGVKFQDLPPVNGREFTSADVKWDLEYRGRIGEFKGKPTDTLNYMFTGMEGVDTPDPYTAIVRFKESFAPFLNYSGSRWNTIMAKDIYQRDGHNKDVLIGTGAYILDTAASQKGSRWVFKKNPNYFEEGRPYIDEIRWLVVQSDAAQKAAYQTKQIDQVDRLAYRAFQEVMAAAPQSESFKYYATNAQQLQPTNKSGPTSDLRVRRAMSIALDRDEINKAIAGGEGLWAIPGALAGTYTQEETKKMIRQDLNEAKRLLADAGYPNGFDLEWAFPSNESQDNLAMYQLVQAQLKRAGINAELKSLELADYRTRSRQGDLGASMSIGGTGQLNADIDSLIFKYHSASTTNYVRSNDPETDRLLEAQRRESDPAKRAALIKQVQMRLMETWPVIDTIYPPRWEAWHPYLKNYRLHYTDAASYRYSWLDK